MPIREILVHDLIEADGIYRIGYIEQDAVPRARACGKPQLRKDGDVVALIGYPRSLRPCPVVAALPQTGDGAAGRVGKDPWTIDDSSFFRCGERNLNHVDAEKGRVGILFRAPRRAPRHLLCRSDDAGPRT